MSLADGLLRLYFLPVFLISSTVCFYLSWTLCPVGSGRVGLSRANQFIDRSGQTQMPTAKPV